MPPKPILLGAEAHIADLAGCVVAGYESYRAALKWGCWDREHVPAGGRVEKQRFALLHTAGGAVLVGQADLCYGPPEIQLAVPVLDPRLVREDEPPPDPVRYQTRGRPAKPKPGSSIRRRRPVIGIGG